MQRQATTMPRRPTRWRLRERRRKPDADRSEGWQGRCTAQSHCMLLVTTCSAPYDSRLCVQRRESPKSNLSRQDSNRRTAFFWRLIYRKDLEDRLGDDDRTNHHVVHSAATLSAGNVLNIDCYSVMTRTPTFQPQLARTSCWRLGHSGLESTFPGNRDSSLV